MLGEFFAANPDEIDEKLIDAPTVDAITVSSVSMATVAFRGTFACVNR